MIFLVLVKHNMKKIIQIIICQVLLFVYPYTVSSKEIGTENLLTSKYAGIYGYGTSQKTGYGEIYFYPETNNTMLFYVYISRGGPSYHVGAMAERIKMVNGKGIFREKLYDDGYCTFYVQFQHDDVIIRTDSVENECGFGVDVFIDGEYRRKTKKIPQFYHEGNDEKIYFKDLSKRLDDKH